MTLMPYSRNSSSRRPRQVSWFTLFTLLTSLILLPSSSRPASTPHLSGLDPTGNVRLEIPTPTSQTKLGPSINLSANALVPTTFRALAPVEDAYVSAAATGSNFGAATELRSRTSEFESYLKFDLSGLGSESVTDAKLRLTGQLNDTSDANVATQVFSVSNTTWTEMSITWSNKPNSGSTALASVTVADNVAGLYEWDVTSFVKSEINAERHLVSRALKNPSTSTPYATFNSRQAATNTPELLITTTPPPNVNITSPAGGASFLAPATVTIDADASDSDGIMQVEFLQDSTVLATDTNFPYSFTWNNVAVGNYTLAARATDSLGATTTSSPVNVSVVLSFPPTVNIT